MPEKQHLIPKSVVEIDMKKSQDQSTDKIGHSINMFPFTLFILLLETKFSFKNV